MHGNTNGKVCAVRFGDINLARYIAYVCRKLRFLLDHGVIPILVFDGDRLPAKKGTEHERQKYVTSYFIWVVDKWL